MTEPMMTIREMCEEFNVTARTLRFYEAKELLFPHREGQKRLYGKRDRVRLKLGGQETQLRETYALSEKHLASMQAQRAELDDAINELKIQMEWGQTRLKELDKKQGEPAG